MYLKLMEMFFVKMKIGYRNDANLVAEFENCLLFLRVG